jgi:hypothetical protein
LRKFARKAHQFGRSETIAGEGFGNVKLAGLDSELFRELADQPGLDRIRAWIGALTSARCVTLSVLR